MSEHLDTACTGCTGVSSEAPSSSGGAAVTLDVHASVLLADEPAGSAAAVAGPASGEESSTSGEANLNFERFIYSTLKKVHPGLSISKKSMYILNEFMKDVFTRIASECC